MAHQVEPMDIDDIEGHFDNKENSYHHSNVVTRTPCTEKGYEELDVTELNMKLRWSTTPAASPMSKSMSNCLDNRYNASTDESLNNTVINENENTLTRSLNSALNKTDTKLPLQTLPADFVDSNRNSTVLLPFDDTVTGNNITITNEIDNISFPSSSSSVTHTPEATTPTKEIPKNNGGSPIMRGLKSVLSMFRPSQSPIPPGEGENKPVDAVLSPVDTSLLDPGPHAVSSTPINQKSKERTLSRKNSPHKESLVFNEDLEKEIQWNDDSTIVFSTEKIPIHELFFQDKASSSRIDKFCLPEKEDVNSSVEYMDVSYGNLSIRDRTLNATVNKSKVNDMESDGEFVDCETTFTQNESRSNPEEAILNKTDVGEPNVSIEVVDAGVGQQATIDIVENNVNNDLQSTFDVTKNVGEDNAIVDLQLSLDVTKDVVKNDAIIDLQATFNVTKDVKNYTINDPQSTFDVTKDEIKNNVIVHPQSELDATQDIMKLLDYSQIVGERGEATEQLDFSTTDIVNQLSDLINASETIDSKVISEHLKNVNLSNTDPLQVIDVLNESVIQQQFLQCEVKSPENPVLPDKNTTLNFAENVSFENNTHKVLDSAVSNPFDSQIDIVSSVSPIPAEPISLEQQTEKQSQDNSVNEKNKETLAPDLSSVDVPLLDEIFSKGTSDSLLEDKNISIGLQSKTMDIVKTTQNVLLQNLDEKDVQIKVQSVNNTVEISSPPSILASDVPLPNTDNDNLVNTYLSHEALTAVRDPVLEQTFKTSNTTISEEKSPNNVIEYVPMTAFSQVEEIEKMGVSLKENPFETLGVDVSIKVTTLSNEHEVDNEIPNPVMCVEESKEDNQLSNTLHDLPEVTMQNVDMTNKSDTFGVENLGMEKVCDSVSVTITDDELAAHDKLKTSNEFNTDMIKEEKLAFLVCGDSIAFVENPNTQEDLTSSVIEVVKPLPHLLETALLDKNLSHPINGTKAQTDSGVNTDTVNSANVVSTNVEDLISPVSGPNSSNQLEIKTENKIEVRNDTIIQEARLTECVSDFETTSNEEKSKQHEGKTDEEILLSENNSPFVSMSAEGEFDPETISEKVENTSYNNEKPLQSAPISPKIVSKGYNFNFDDFDSMDPFATKTKISISPPLGASPKVPLETAVLNKTEKSHPLNKVNKRKSMSEKKRLSVKKNNFNSTFDRTECAPTKQTQLISKSGGDSSKVEKCVETEIDVVAQFSQELDATQPDGTSVFKPDIIPCEDNNTDIKLKEVVNTADIAYATVDDVTINDSKSSVNVDTSSSEQSTYFSAGTSSTDCSESKNVFNLPEIDDKNFNPFATKSRIRQSPPLEDIVNSSVTTDEIGNFSGSSKSTDEQNDTVQEVHTEDEDTIEGPFLESEDGDDGDKIPESDNNKTNMVEFKNINDENTDAAEIFIDAEAFEFLMNQNKADEVAYSGKESLFLKFDPLFSRRVTSEGVAAALNEIKRRQNTPKKTPLAVPAREEDILLLDKFVAGPSSLNVTREVQSPFEESRDDMNVTVSKPMMVVPPAVNPVVTPRQTATPNRTNRLSMTFTSPAMAVIDRLLSLSGGSPSAGLDSTVTHVSQEHYEADQALTQLRELLAEKEINVYNLRCESNELKNRLCDLETQMRSLEAESAQRLKKVNELTENLSERTKMNRNMAAVVEECERTIASLISETEQDKKRYAEERNQLIRERDEQSAHLTSMEVSFNDLHSKYEKSKQIIMGYKSNEETYKKSLTEFENNLSKMHSNYELLKQHATSKLNYANQELEKLNRAHEAEVLKFNAMIKRKDMHITSLEESLAQKTKANEELTAICDELINKVG